MILVAPEDRRAAFRSNHGVNRILQHVHAVRHADRKSAARSAFPGDGRDDRYSNLGHLPKIERDRFRLPAFFRIDSRVCPRGIDERQDRASELLRKLHDPESLPVAFGLGHPEVAVLALFGVPALLVADQADWNVTNRAETANDGRIIAELPD